MLTIGDKKILIGGFHDHWHRIDTENSAYLLSALNYYNYDFVTLMDGIKHSTIFQNQCERFTDKIKLHSGKEYGCPWGHIVAVGFKDNCNEDDLYHEVAQLTEVDEVFRHLKTAYELVILAHPDYEITWRELFLTGEVDRLIDENIIDAVNIINTLGFTQLRHRILIDWYKKREIAGKRTPIVGGWDAHLMMNRINDPDILYTRNNSPQGHIDTGGYNRSIIIDSNNDLPSIIKAVKECRILVEDIESGEFVGPKHLIEFLNNNNYNQEVAKLADERDKIIVSKKDKWFLNESAEITFNQNGTLIYPISKNATEKVAIIADKPAILRKVSLDLIRDEVGIPLAFTNKNNFEAIYSVRASHPICIDVVSKYEGSKQYIEVQFVVPFEGEITITSSIFPQSVKQNISKDQSEIMIEVKDVDTTPIKYHLEARNHNGISRSFDGIVTFYPVQRFNNSWDTIPIIKIDKDEFVPKELGYANTEPWIGAELFSGSVQIAWTPEGLHIRIDVIDPIHDQPLEGHFIYDADCVQVAIDPLCLRRGYRGHFYNYNLALTNKGPELFQMFTPDLDVNDNPISMPEDISLGSKYLTIEKREKGLIYNVTLPWELLGLTNPQSGDRMGIYFILLNSNGNGVINNLRWPLAEIDGGWMIPKRWGTISLI